MTKAPKIEPSQTDAAGNGGNTKRELFSSGVGVLLIKVANAGLGLVTIVLFARLMPPDEYGFYMFVLTVSQFLALPLQMGLPVLVTREIATAIEERRAGLIEGLLIWSRGLIVNGALIIGLSIIFLYSFIAYMDWGILQGSSWSVVVLIVLLVPAIAEMKRVMGILNGYRLAAQSRLPDGIVRPSVLIVIGATGLWLGWFGATGLLSVYLVAALVAMFFGWFLVHRTHQGAALERGQPVEYKRDAWRKSLWPLTFFAAAAMIKMYSDVLMLGILDSQASVAFYKIAAQISGLSLMAQLVVNIVLGPRLAALNSRKEPKEMQSLAVWGSRLAFAAAFTFLLCLCALGEGGFAWLLGSDYAPVYGLTMCLTVGMALSAVFGGTTMMLNMARREKYSAKYASITAAINIILNLVLIPGFGALGAAIATVISMLCMQILCWGRLLSELGIRTDAFARKLS